MKQALIGYGAVALSVAVHGGALLGSSRPVSPARRVLTTQIELTPPVSPRPSRQPTEPEPPPPKLATALRARPLTTATPPPSPPPAAEREPELTGKTLTADSDASWAAASGNGNERAGPIVAGPAPVSAPTPVPLARPQPAAASSPATQPLAQLSRKPAPPPLSAALERNYPPAARSQGRTGEAKVRALIDARGRVASVVISSESAAGFGAACQKTLLLSQWSAPLGKLGEPTATFVTYRCRFQVEH